MNFKCSSAILMCFLCGRWYQTLSIHCTKVSHKGYLRRSVKVKINIYAYSWVRIVSYFYFVEAYIVHLLLHINGHHTDYFIVLTLSSSWFYDNFSLRLLGELYSLRHWLSFIETCYVLIKSRTNSSYHLFLT